MKTSVVATATIARAHRRVYDACERLGVVVPDRERDLDPLDDAQSAIAALRRARHHALASRLVRVLYDAEDRDLRAVPGDPDALASMHWPRCTAWLRSAA